MRRWVARWPTPLSTQSRPQRNRYAETDMNSPSRILPDLAVTNVARSGQVSVGLAQAGPIEQEGCTCHVRCAGCRGRFFSALLAGNTTELDDLIAEDFAIVDVISGAVTDQASFLCAAADCSCSRVSRSSNA